MYALLLAIIYLAFVSLGLPDSLVGSGWPVMHEDLAVPTSFAGIITFIIALCTIVSSLSSDRMTRRFGVGLVTAVSVAMTALALLGFSVSTQFWMLLVWAVPYGLGAGAVDAALNNYVALYYNARHMNWLHSFWGVGASISPFIMSFALSSGSGWESAYAGVGWIQVVLAAFLFATLPMWRKVATTHTAAAGEAPVAKAVSLGGALRIPGVPNVLLAFFAYCAMESTAILWGATYFVNDRGLDPTLAARFGAFYILGLTAGRFLAGFVADRLGDSTLIRIGFSLAVLGALVLALPLGNVSFVGLVLAGVGSAPVYPAIIHSTPTNFGRENSQAIVGIQMAAAYTGSTVMPPLFGFISSATGLWLFPLYLMGLGALGLLMSERLRRR